MRRASSRSRAARLYLASLFRLRRHGHEGLIRPVAYVPGLRDEPAPGPQCRKEHLALRTAKWVRAEPSGANAARWGIRSLSIPGVYARGVSTEWALPAGAAAR